MENNDIPILNSTTCTICKKDFIYKSHLDRHNRRKTSCNPIVDIDDLNDEHKAKIEKAKAENRLCPFCNRVLSSHYALKKHIHSGCPIAPNKKNGTRGMDLLYQHTKEKEYSKNSQKNSSGVNIGSIADSTVNNTVDNRVINNVTINVHGQENLDYITEDDVAGIYDSALTAENMKKITKGDLKTISEVAQAVLAKSLSMVFNNKMHPENFTAYIPDMRQFVQSNPKKIMVRGDSEWSMEESKKVYETVTDTIMYNLIGQKQPRGTEYVPVTKKLFKVKQISEALLVPVIGKIRELLVAEGLLPKDSV